MISLGLIGYPLAHSLSPKIHTAAMNYTGLKGRYSLYPVPPGDLRGLKDLLDRVRNGGIAGLNVTIPYKQEVIPLLDELTPVAQAIGAVNTIFMRNGKLMGDNTDAPGFLADLHQLFAAEAGECEEGKNVLVLGAGGAARAVVYALLVDGWIVTIASRRQEQARALIAQLADHQSVLAWVDYTAIAFKPIVSSLALVINATPVGMAPDAAKSPWQLGMPLPRRAVFYDLVYTPLETKFVQDARLAGMRASTGLGMLVEQAALSFEIWTGFDVPREPLLAALEEK
jgi:shikimate dehydrogenase